MPSFYCSICCIALLLCSAGATAQQTFQKTYGGPNFEEGAMAAPTRDGGYIMLGSASSSGPMDANMYLLKTDAAGNMLWNKAVGGDLSESGYSVQQTKDGGFVIAGNTYSFGAGSGDLYVVKTDSIGEVSWSRTYGRTLNDGDAHARQTFDGGYIIAGATQNDNAGDWDVLLIKADANGDTVWTRTYSAGYRDEALCVRQTADSGYLLAGATSSNSAAFEDAFLLRTDASGNLLWANTYGGADAETFNDVAVFKDGSIVATGNTHSFGATEDGDLYVVKTDSTGALQWAKQYGGSSTEWGYSAIPQGNTLLIAGLSYSYGAGHDDALLIKTNDTGAVIWAKTYGGPSFDFAYSVAAAPDGGYILAGGTSSAGAGITDLYLIKTDSAGASGCNDEAASIAWSVVFPVVQPVVFAPAGTAPAVSSPQTMSGSGGSEFTICQSNTTGINAAPSTPAYRAFPNPAGDAWTLTTTATDDAEVLLTDPNGRVVLRQEIRMQQCVADLQQLQPGLYFFQVLRSNGTRSGYGTVTVIH